MRPVFCSAKTSNYLEIKTTKDAPSASFEEPLEEIISIEPQSDTRNYVIKMEIDNVYV